MISGHYVENYIVKGIALSPQAFQYNTWWGENTYNSQFSPYQRTMDKCDAINFFLYGSEYLKGDKPFNKVSWKKREKTLSDFYRFVIVGDRSKSILMFHTTEFARRTRLFV